MKTVFYMEVIIKRITRSAIILEINTKDVKLVKTNICKCLLERKDEILVFTNFTSLVLISTMIALLVILFIIKLHARNNTFKYIMEVII